MTGLLTPDLKDRTLREWNETLDEQRPYNHDWVDYRPGYPDAAMLPWVERLNRIDGLVTLQSCTGHRHPEGHLDSGTLWLWLDAAMMAAFEPRAFELSTDIDHIESVAVVFGGAYGPMRTRFVDVRFRGDEHGMFPESITRIVSFFESLRP